MSERKKARLDQVLVDRELTQSRSAAKAAILEGRVVVAGHRVTKAGTLVARDVDIRLKQDKRQYASRGGKKLEGAWLEFQFAIDGHVVLDGGASTGGFTDFVLQHGAKSVYAVDVGYGQLAWNLRQDPRVVVLERTNLRNLTEESLPKPAPDLVVLDLSFISLAKVLPAVYLVSAVDCECIALCKPQFEAGPSRVGKGGVVREARIHRDVLESVKLQADEIGFRPIELCFSPITGPKGNIEFFLRLAKGKALASKSNIDLDTIDGVVSNAHAQFDGRRE